MGPDFELDGRAVTSRPASSRRRRTMSIQGLMKLVFILACIFGLFSLLSRGEPHGERARRYACVNNLKQILIALETYEQVHGMLPPAYVADASGRPMHSWRVLILPFLDQQSLYDQYDFREPWDGPNNSKLLNSMPSCFACPNLPRSLPNMTSYAAITGPGTMFPGAGSVKLGDVTDGLRDTLMVVEVANLKIPWTAPIDLDIRTMSMTLNDPYDPGISSPHPVGASIGFGDTWVRSLTHSIPEETLRALITIAGGEGVKVDEVFP